MNLKKKRTAHGFGRWRKVLDRNDKLSSRIVILKGNH
jgi:hypothetical protein